jgi:GTPase Era involved in 16S rRNA processing
MLGKSTLMNSLLGGNLIVTDKPSNNAEKNHRHFIGEDYQIVFLDTPEC